MSKILFGADHLSVQEMEAMRKIEEEHGIDENIFVVEAVRRFLRAKR